VSRSRFDRQLCELDRKLTLQLLLNAKQRRPEMEIKRNDSQPSGILLRSATAGQEGPVEYLPGAVRIDPMFEAKGACIRRIAIGAVCESRQRSSNFLA
jgi:hypothetical protein